MSARVLVLSLAIALLGGPAAAQTGVSDDRVSLPSGPGSLEGLGENADLNLNTGTMTYSVEIETPDGFLGMAPELALRYSSGGGTTVVGMGWEGASAPSSAVTDFRLPLVWCPYACGARLSRAVPVVAVVVSVPV